MLYSISGAKVLDSSNAVAFCFGELKVNGLFMKQVSILQKRECWAWRFEFVIVYFIKLKL